ncbi:MAG: hypothetical protein ISR65_03785 [Bacteriovoracaceae bacterium]|nr:hypothetical protein [Bacteriovoracaceae bacterium]
MKVMKQINLVLFFGAFIFLISAAHSLELDEKLTLRVLKVSDSKKTVLINRGLEDGLVVGDHAKFFQTDGVVARGVVVKASPSRSIWSLYRIIARQFVRNDYVMKLKIASPVELTDDATKMIVPQIPISDSPSQEDLGAADQEDLSMLKADEQKVGRPTADEAVRGSASVSGVAWNKTWELYANIYFNGLGSTRVQSGSSVVVGKSSASDFSFGFEKYFSNQHSWIHKFSLAIFLHTFSQNTVISAGDEKSESAFEYGVAVSWHFLEDPLAYHRLIAMVVGTFGLGISKDVIDNEGSSNFFSGGVGTKYYFKNGVGVRAIIDYYFRNESYIIENADDYSIKVSGPRILVGLSYRW